MLSPVPGFFSLPLAAAHGPDLSAISRSPLDFSWASTAEGWISLVILVMLEIILGIDNIIFQSIKVETLAPEQQERGRKLGLLNAMFLRLLLLSGIVWILSWQNTLFTLFGQAISGKDLVMLLGGAFLIFQSTREIHEKLEGEGEVGTDGLRTRASVPFVKVMLQIAVMDLVFSLDSVITAVGSAKWVSVMMLAVIISVGVMFFFAPLVAGFVKKHPTIKILALSFLILIGTALVAEGLGLVFPKGYIYFAMAFSFMVELVNLKLRDRAIAKKTARVTVPH